jgi:hypothetical protein
MAAEKGADARVTVEIAGLSILVYSPRAADHIGKGEHYLKAQYWEPGDVLRHLRDGGMVSFGVGAPGRYFLELRTGYPEEAALDRADYKLVLGLRVQGQRVCFRDLFDLAEWDPACPIEQTMEAPDGNYYLTVHSDAPESGILGEDQTIWIYFQPVEVLPALQHAGVPSLV